MFVSLENIIMFVSLENIIMDVSGSAEKINSKLTIQCLNFLKNQKLFIIFVLLFAEPLLRIASRRY